MSDEQARTAAREILAEARFTRWHDEFEAWLRAIEGMLALVPDWLLESADWLFERLKTVLWACFEALGWLLGFFGFIDTPHETLGWIAAILLIAIGCVAVYRLAGDRFTESRSPAFSDAAPASHAAAIREATTLASRGEFLEAARRVQLATLNYLVERGWIELARSDPNRTLRQRVAASTLPSQERGELIGLVDRLESLWFDAPIEDASLFEDWLALDSRIVRFGTGPNR